MKYVAICTALYDYQAQQDGEELSFNADDTLYILDNKDPDWLKAQLKVPVDQDARPIGLIPSNYVEKAKPIGHVKALYDYEPQSIEEVAFKEDDILTLYEKDDPDWLVVEKANGDIGLAPSNYVESCDITATVAKAPTATKAPTTTKAPTPAIAVEIIKEASASCAPKWAIALFAFTPESSEETSLEDHEQVLITDYVSNKDWWTIEHKDGASGIVPSSYVKFQDEYEADLRAEEEQEEKKRLEAAATATREMEKKRQQEQDQRDKERQRELAEHNRMKEQEEKEKARQAEAERRRKMQEEAKQREIDAKRQASFVAASPQLGSGSPRRSQIPAPLPPSQPISSPSYNHQQMAAQSKHLDPNKPDPARIRMWTDRTGAFKVEAQFLSCANGKIRLHKTNGVKIDVPTQKMCVEDLQYIEQETGMKLLEDKSDNIPLAQLGNHHGRFSWFDYFKKANLPHKACVEYAGSFDANKLTEQDIERLTHSKMKLLGMSERHVRRIQRFFETNRAEPPSDDESSKSKIKTKKSVTFGAVSYIPDSDDEQEDDVQWQIEQDERLARQLQEEEQGQTNTVGLQRRGTARPTPSHSAPRDVNSSVLIPQQFHSDLLKPVPAAPVAASVPAPMKPVVAAAAPVAVPLSAPMAINAAQPGFEDDAWAPRGNSPSVQPASTSTWTPPQQTPPQMPPRQRPTPQLSQQSMVDPQLLAKWGGSPALAAANTNRPVPPPPTNRFASLQQIQQQQQQQLQQQNQQISSASVPVIQSQASMTSLPVQNTMYQKSVMTGSFASSPSAPPSIALFSSAPSLQVQQQQGFMNASPSLYNSQPTAVQQTVPLQSVLPPPLLPQATGYSPQMTGASRNWANATPDNPFGSAGGGSSPMIQSTPNNQFQQQQPMTAGSVYQNGLTVQHTGYVPPQPLTHYNSSSAIDRNDKYSVFKTVNTSAPSVFNNNLNNNQQQQQQHSFYY